VNKALYIPALFLSLSASPLPGAGPLPDSVAVVPSRAYMLSVDPPALSAEIDEPSAAMPHGNTNARFGTQKLAYQSLIHRDRDRPGAVAGWRPGLQTDVRGFVFHPEFHDRSWMPDRRPELDHQLLGVVAEHELPLTNSDTLTFTGGWVAGHELSDPYAAGEAATGTQAWSLGADASLLKAQLRLSFELAGSGGDDGGTGKVPGKRAEAHRLGAEWQASRTGPLRWHAGTEYRWVGPEFESAANDELKADRQQWRGYGGLAFHDWEILLSAQEEGDNLAGDPRRPSERVERYRVGTTWTPADAGSGWALGKPRVRVVAEQGGNEKVSASEGGEQVSPFHQLRLESEFGTAARRWGAKAARGQTPGAIDSPRSAGIETLGLELYHDQRTLKELPIKTALQWQQRQDRATGTTEERWQATLGGRPVATHDRLEAGFDLRYRHLVRSDSRDPQDDLSVAGRLVWTLDRPGPSRSGLAVSLNAHYRTPDAPVPSKGPESRYQVLLTLSTVHR
jgi:hypothetical protein